MTQQQIDRVEEIRDKVNSVTSGELRNCDYEDAVNMNNELRDLIPIIDQLRAEPTLLEKLMVDRKTNVVILLLDGTQIVYSPTLGYNIIPPEGRDICLETYGELSQHLSSLLEKEV